MEGDVSRFISHDKNIVIVCVCVCVGVERREGGGNGDVCPRRERANPLMLQLNGISYERSALSLGARVSAI